MSSVEFVIPGPPQGKGRARSTRSGIHFTPKKTVLYENKVMTCFQEAADGWRPTEKPVSVEITARFQIPVSATKKSKLAMMLQKILPTKKPDIDNIAKAVFDGLNGVAWLDDKQIVKLVAEKIYPGEDEDASVTVVVSEIVPEEEAI